MDKEKELIPVDPPSELKIYIDSEDYPFTDITQLQFKGKLDAGAFAEAWDEALKLVPLFSSHLTVKRRGLLYKAYWKYVDDIPNLLNIQDCRHLAKRPFDPMDLTIKFHLVRSRRKINLYNEFPFVGYLLRVLDDTYILSIVYQHSIFEPFKYLTVITALLANYHKKVKGQKPKWANSIGTTTLAKDTKDLWVPPRGLFFTYPIALIWDSVKKIKFRNPVKVSNIATREVLDYKKVKGRYSILRIIENKKVIDALIDRTKRNKATLNDLIMAVALQAITNWNKKYNAKGNHFRMALGASMKGRTKLPKNFGLGLSIITFLVKADEDGDLDELICYFRDYRRNQLERRDDIKAFFFFSQLFRFLRILPLNFRLKSLVPLISSMSLDFSFGLSNVGVIWPKVVNGKPTLDSEVLSAGDLKVDGIHSCPTGGKHCSLLLISRMFNRKLYWNFIYNRFKFRKDEAEELTDLIIKGVMDAAKG